MATNHVEDVKNQGDKIVSEYETNMNSIIDANNAAKDKALGEIGEMGADGKWTEGSAIGALIDSQNEQTDFSIQQIEQQKAQAGKDYIKEQSGAYADWQKQSNPYGANAEAMASQGMQNSGYSETSQVSMYNQYQARVTAAREAYQKIILDYDNQMTAARMQNNATIAQIAYEGLQKRLEVMMQFTMQGTELLTTLASQKAAIKQQNLQNYMSVYNDVVNSSGSREDDDPDEGGIDEDTDGSGIAYKDAVKYLVACGVPESYASFIQTPAEWSRHKSNYNTYEEYLNETCQIWLEKQPWLK